MELCLSAKDKLSSNSLSMNVWKTYAAFGVIWFTVVSLLPYTDFSTILTAGAMMQCLGFVLLCLRVNKTKSVEGLSSKTLELFAIFLVFRLTSTCLKNGYIPVDPSGDFFYQLLDVCSLVCVIYLLHRMHNRYVYTYQDEHDRLTIRPLVLPCIVLGVLCHGNFNRSHVFDAIWSTSLNLETLTMLPQLAMLARVGGKVDTVTCHWIVLTVGACVCRFMFWAYAWGELDSEIAGLHILLMHVLQLLLCGDFLFYYVKSWINWSDLILPTEAELTSF